MPVSSETSISGPYIPNGSTKSFAFDFKATAANEVVAVDQNGATISAALYSVTLDDDEGGTLTFGTAPALSDYSEIYVIGNPSLTQPSDFDNAGPSFNPAALTRALDRAAARDLKQQREIDRGLKMPFGESGGILPPRADLVGKFPSVNAEGDWYGAPGTGNDPALRGELATGDGELVKVNDGASGAKFASVKTFMEYIRSDAGGDAIAYTPPLTGAVASNIRAALSRRVYLQDFGVTAITSATYNTAALQAAFDTLAHEVIVPPFAVVMNGTAEFKANGQVLRGLSRGKSRLVKSSDTDPRLLYAEGLSDVTVQDLELDGARSQTATFIDSKWLIFFRLCVRPTVRNCLLHKCLTDALVFELCTDPFSEANFCSDNNKGGIYWSSCDGGQSVRDTCDNNGASTPGIGNGFLVACSWKLTITSPMAKNNIQGQIIASRGTRDLLIMGGQLGDRLQTRGSYSFYAIGEAISGTVHGITYDGATLYGSEDVRLIGVECYLPPLISKAARLDFQGCNIENLSIGQVHGAIVAGCTKVSFRGGRIINSNGAGVGIALTADDATPKLTPTNPTDLLVEGVDFHIASGNRVYDYTSGSATWCERSSVEQGVPVGRNAITDLSVTVTTGSLPAVTNTLTIANGAAPTVSELLKYCVELETRVEGILDRMRTKGDIVP